MFPDPDAALVFIACRGRRDAVCDSPMVFTGDMGMHPGTVRLPIV